MKNNTLTDLSAGLADAVEAISPSLLTVLGRHVNATATAWGPDGVLVTANHNLPRDAQPRLRLPDGEERAARVLGRDPATDLALLQLPGLELPLPTWTEDAPRVGELALAVGHAGRSPRVTLGLVSEVRGPWSTPWGGRVDRWLEVDGHLPMGFSGGPLLSASGEVLGINTRSLVRGGTTLPTETLRRVLGALAEDGQVRRGFLGVGITPDLRVTELVRGGPAAQAGLQEGDRITAVDGQAVDSAHALGLSLTGRVGETLLLVYERDGEAHQTRISVAEQPPRRRRRCR